MVAKYDLVVIGAGSAGEKGAAQAAYFGKRVAVVDPKPRPGGIAVSTAGIPTKTLREGAIYLSGLGQSAGGLVAAAGARDPWRLLMTRKLEVSEFMTMAVEASSMLPSVPTRSEAYKHAAYDGLMRLARRAGPSTTR